MSSKKQNGAATAAAAGGAGKDRTDLPEILFADVAKHNTHDDAWLVVHGIVYNVTEWAKRHPGGDVILLGAGTDSTILFESYHPNGVASAVLDKYAIGRVEPKTGPVSFYDWSGEFYPTLKKRVADRLRQKNLPTRGGLCGKAALIMSTFCLGYCMLLFGGPVMSWVGSIVWALAATHIGLGIMHDGNHGAFASNDWFNKFAGWGMDLIGASGLVWEFQHVVGHHQYTNLQTNAGPQKDTRQFDPDTFSSYPLVRMHTNNKRMWYNRFQHLYAPVLFGLMTLSRVFWTDIDSVALNKKVMPSGIDMLPRLSNHGYLFRFYAMKVLTTVLFLIIPIMVHGFAKGFGLFFVAHTLCSFYLAVCFIVNHISEGCSFFTAGTEYVMSEKQKAFLEKQPRAGKKAHPNDWAALQARSCVNWCSGSWFWNHFSGGLNHQIEHHLFPSISHVHYPVIQPIVQKTCEEYGVPYFNHTSFWSAWKDMIGQLYLFGHFD